jgi:hypothetical protein
MHSDTPWSTVRRPQTPMGRCSPIPTPRFTVLVLLTLLSSGCARTAPPLPDPSEILGVHPVSAMGQDCYSVPRDHIPKVLNLFKSRRSENPVAFESWQAAGHVEIHLTGHKTIFIWLYRTQETVGAFRIQPMAGFPTSHETHEWYRGSSDAEIETVFRNACEAGQKDAKERAKRLRGE